MGAGRPRARDVIEAAISSAAETVISPPGSGQIPESRNEFIQSLENVKRTGSEIYKYLTYAVVAVLIVGGIYYASVATTANGLILVAVLLFGIAAIVFAQMERFQQLMTWTPSINITKTVTMGEPTVVMMGIDAMRKAQDLITAGKDMDSVCREIEPEYANWGSVQQQVFRKMLEAVLKMDRSKGMGAARSSSSRICSIGNKLTAGQALATRSAERTRWRASH